MKKVIIGMTCGLLSTQFLCEAGTERQLPVACDVDVVVAGGSSAAVAAASEISKKGLKVFLVTPRNYLGEDIAGTLQLWLKEGETPSSELARELYNDPCAKPLPVLDYTYSYDRKGVAPYADTKPPMRLAGKSLAVDPLSDGVIFDGNVTISADLGEVKDIRMIELDSFVRKDDFFAGEVKIETSLDGKTWKPLAATLTRKDIGGIERFSAPATMKVRHAKVTVALGKGAKRIVLGRLSFYPPSDEKSIPTEPSLPVRPMHVKTVLEKALRSSGVQYFFRCYPTELLLDEQGRAAGIVIADGMGRQAIRAKLVIDATETASLARLAGVEFIESKTPRTLRWVTIATTSRGDEKLKAEKLSYGVYKMPSKPGKPGPAWYEYTMQSEIADNNWPARAELEDYLRAATYVKDQQYTSDTPFLVPASSIKSLGSTPKEWTPASALPLELCRPAKTERLWVLGGSVDVSRENAEKLLRPVQFMQLGERLGNAVAEEAKHVEAPQTVKVLGALASGEDAVQRASIREPNGKLRPILEYKMVEDSEAALPVLGRYDVVVVGGGTSGAPAGIAAARQGAKTLVIEHLYGMGGVGTLGGIGGYWYGNRVGFTTTVPQNPVDVRMEFYRSELRKAGGEVWFGTLGYGAVLDDKRLKGVVLATPQGRGVVLAKVIIDGTGNSDIAAAAGAETRFVEDFFALQHSLVPFRKLGLSYLNGDCPPVDAADPIDNTNAFSNLTKVKHNNWIIYGYKFTDHIDPNGERRTYFFDLGQSLGSRERRKIVGDFCLDWLDQVNLRTFPDSIALAQSDYDSHGYQIHPYFMLKNPRPVKNEFHQFQSYVPYRCLLPRGYEGILVVGLGLSANRDAMPIVRMQPDLHNIGYASGLAAAMASKEGKTPREIDIRALQKMLVEVGNIKEEVLSHKDSFPIASSLVEEAVKKVGNNYDKLEIVLANPEAALPLLIKAYDTAEPEQKLCYAHVLGIIGNAHGVPTLIADAEKRLAKADFTVKREADGMDRITQLIWALGHSGDRRCIPLLCKFGEQAVGESPSFRERFRAIAVSLASFRDSSAAPVLAKMLKYKLNSDDPEEIIAACALFRCGDSNGMAKAALERFAKGINSAYAQLAWQVLQDKK